MSTRFCLYAGGTLFAAAAALAVAGQWVAAAAPLMVVAYLAGRWDRRQRVAGLRAELEQAHGQVWALTEERRFVWNVHLARRADDGLYDNGAGHLSPAVLLDRNSNSTADATGGVRAQVRSARLP